MENAIEIYKSLSKPPVSMLRPIKEGVLKGKTDINPQWRYEVMTEKFGLVGIGWKYEVQKLWTEQGAKGEVLCFAQVAVFVKNQQSQQWSDAIVGIGGSKLVNNFQNGLKSNDEGFKMAVTDAFSTSLKMLGVAADIYAGRWNGTKYTENQNSENKQENKQKQNLSGQTLKGGPDTEAEHNKINELLSTRKADGTLVFTQEEMKQVCVWRKSRTAQEVINYLAETIFERNRISPSIPENEEEFPEDIPF